MPPSKALNRLAFSAPFRHIRQMIPCLVGGALGGRCRPMATWLRVVMTKKGCIGIEVGHGAARILLSRPRARSCRPEGKEPVETRARRAQHARCGHRSGSFSPTEPDSGNWLEWIHCSTQWQALSRKDQKATPHQWRLARVGRVAGLGEKGLRTTGGCREGGGFGRLLRGQSCLARETIRGTGKAAAVWLSCWKGMRHGDRLVLPFQSDPVPPTSVIQGEAPKCRPDA